MALTPGTRLGVYEITVQIGEGGMGQVYRATDTRLKRQVAIKILPSALAADHDRLARFQREAEVLASLNHPNIAAIHGLEESGGLTALVMELVEGDDLSQRIARGRIPIDEALSIARQIAEALEAAHEQGIIHRDLKPANIKVRPDGTVKVLDFGLAKAMDVGDRSVRLQPDFSHSPTITTPAMTQAGMILGTAAYMSPEQARGKPVDKRADIWAFGAVLYEMLTGTRVFDAEDVSMTLSMVLQREPDFAALPPAVPARVSQVLRVCLRKDPKQRVGDIRDVRLALEGAFDMPATPEHGGPRAPASWTRVALTSTATFMLGAVLAGGAIWMAAPSVPTRVTHTAITLTPDLPLSPTSIALSADGQTLAMTAGNQLVLRRLGNTTLTPLPGTEGGTNPFFSPDGNWVGFVAEGEFRRIRVDGTSRQTIGRPGRVPVTPPYWAGDDTIYFGVTGQGLSRVPAAWGAPIPLTQPRREAGEISHESPQVLDDGRAILFTLIRADGSGPALLNVASGEWRAIQGITSDFARYAPGGHLLYRRGEGVFAVALSLASGTTTGTPEALFGGVLAGASTPSIAMSADGTLAYLPSSIDSGFEGKISIVNRGGVVTTAVDANVVRLLSGVTSQLRFSSGGQTMVAVIQAAPSTSDLWIYDLGRGARTRLTDQGPVNTAPVWSPDGRQVAFNSTREPAGIYLQPIDTPGAATLLLKRGPGSQAPGAWSPDGRTLVFVENNPLTGADLWTLTLDGKASPMLVTPAQEGSPRLSPDGRWLAYQSDTAGRDDVYVASFPTLGRTQLVSIDGGTSPRWAGGREIVYRRGRQLVSVTVTPGETVTLGRPTVLFEVDDVIDQYDVSPDGTTFLVLHRDAARAGAAPGQVNLVLNLFEELKRLVPTQ